MTEKLKRRPYIREGDIKIEYRKITSPKRWWDWNKEPKPVGLEEAVERAKKSGETIGVATYEEIKNRTLAIARGEYKPSKDEPKILLQKK